MAHAAPPDMNKIHSLIDKINIIVYLVAMTLKIGEDMETISQRHARNRTPISALLSANTISQVGIMLTVVAVPWFVRVTSGSAVKTGLTGVFAALPFIIGGIFGGSLVETP